MRLRIAVIAGLILFGVGMKEIGASQIPLYSVPYDYIRIEVKDCLSLPLEMPAAASALKWPYKDIAEILLESYNQTLGSEKTCSPESLATAFLYIGPETAPLALALLRNGSNYDRDGVARSINDFVVARKRSNAPEDVNALAQVIARNKLLAPIFLDALKSDAESVRMTAACALGFMGLPQETYAPALLETLRDPSDYVKICAAWGLGWGIGFYAIRPVDSKRFALPAEFAAYAKEKSASNYSPGKGIEPFSRILLPLSQKERAEEVRMLLTSDSRETRQQGLWQIQLLGESYRDLMPLLLKYIESSPDSWDITLEGLPLQEQDMVDIGQLLYSDNVEARKKSAHILLEAAPLAKPAVPALLHALDDPDPDVRERAMWTLATPALTGCTPIEKLVPLTIDKDTWVASSAIKVLGRMGTKASSAAPDILVALRSDDDNKRRAAVEALLNITPENDEIVTEFLSLFPDGLGNANDALWDGLISMGKARKSAADLIVAEYRRQLVTPKSDSFPPYRGHLSEVVALLGEEYLPIAAEGLQSAYPTVRAATLNALAGQGKPAAFSLQKVLDLTNDEDAHVRLAAVVAMSALAPADEGVRKAMLTAIHDNDNTVSATAIREVMNIEFSPEEKRLVGQKLLRLLQTRELTQAYIPPQERLVDAPSPPRKTPFIVQAVAKFCVESPTDLIELSKTSGSNVKEVITEAFQIADTHPECTPEEREEALRRGPQSIDDIDRMIALGVPSEDIAKKLAGMLENGSESAQLQTINMLYSMREKTKPAVPALTTVLKPDEPLPNVRGLPFNDPRIATIMILRDFAWDDDTAVKTLITVARNSENLNRHVIRALEVIVTKRREHGL